MVEDLAFMGVFITIFIVQFSALWHRLGRVEGKIESIMREHNVN